MVYGYHINLTDNSYFTLYTKKNAILYYIMHYPED